MKSLYAAYILEREGIETVETDEFFFTFKMIENEFHVFEIFVREENRHSMKVFDLMDQIDKLSKEKGAKYIVSTVIPGMPNSEKSILLQLRWGMKLLKCEGNKIYLVKDISNG